MAVSGRQLIADPFALAHGQRPELRFRPAAQFEAERRADSLAQHLRRDPGALGLAAYPAQHVVELDGTEGLGDELDLLAYATLSQLPHEVPAAGQGVLVRYFAKAGLQDCIRISAGTPDDTDRLVEALREVEA